MKTIKLSDVNLLEVGNTINFSGIIWNDTQSDLQFVTLFPDISKDDFSVEELKLMELTTEEWQQLLRQTDLQETMMLVNDDGKIKKAIYRKSQRQIDSRVQWQVFARDNYTCRYTGETGIPLTVDHVDLYEEGGASIVENLISCTKKANKLRGNMPYDVWINSSEYKKISKNLPEQIKQANLAVLETLDDLKTKRVYNIRSR